MLESLVFLKTPTRPVGVHNFVDLGTEDILQGFSTQSDTSNIVFLGLNSHTSNSVSVQSLFSETVTSVKNSDFLSSVFEHTTDFTLNN